MWGVPIALWGLAAQLPLNQQLPSTTTTTSSPTMTAVANATVDFAFKEGPDVFSPKDLVELARPGAGVANDAGDLFLTTVSKYSMKDKKNEKSIYLAAIESIVSPVQIPLKKTGEAFWLDTRTVAHAVEEGEGKDAVTALYAISVKFDKNSTQSGQNDFTVSDEHTLIGKFPTNTPSNFQYSAKSGTLVFSDNVWPDGVLTKVKAQDEAWENRGDSAFVYDETFERHWDTWTGPKRPSLFSVSLKSDSGKWELGTSFKNVLYGTGLHTPVEPFGGSDDFSVSDTHIVFTAKDPKLPPAWHTKQNVYIIDIHGKSGIRELTSGKQGATHNPVFNAGGNKAAWVELKRDGHESDKGEIVIYDLKTDVRFTLTHSWDRTASELAFSEDGSALYFTAGDHARIKVWALPVPPTPKSSTTEPELSTEYLHPHALTHTGAVSSIQVLPNHRLLFTRSSLTSPSDISVIHHLDTVLFSPEDGSAQNAIKVERLTKFTEDALSTKSLSEGEAFYFEGANKKTIHGWILKPPGFKAGEKKKWPPLLFIHGGPEGAWEDQWSTRWNPNVFAQQGYFVIAINPTGSTTFGQELTDAIQGDWGGKPFVDMKKGWDYVLSKHPEIDSDRAVAAGASYGGYSIHWIQGHPEYGFGFKALVCHDGSFDTRYTGYATDELFFANYEFGGPPWEKGAAEIYEKWNPVNFVHKWSTPQLLIHGSKDYRLVEGDSLGAFHALQQRKVPTRLVIFPDENHWVLNHGNSLKWHYEVFRWLDKFVGKKSADLETN